MDTNLSISFDQIPRGILPVLIVIVIVLLGFQIATIVRIARTPAQWIVLVPGLEKYSKIVWILIALLGNTLGAIIAFVFAVIPQKKRSDPTAQTPVQDASSVPKEVVDILYGSTAPPQAGSDTVGNEDASPVEPNA